jgi:hypothetical protein
MKKLFFIAAIAAVATFGCTDKKTESGTHTREDGSAHENHEESTTAQEEFTTDSATTPGSLQSDSAHTHEDRSTHSH